MRIELKHSILADKQYDLFICLDCGDEDRLGFSLLCLEAAKKTFCIDHHVEQPNIAR
ncbi:MAG: hypothetical protein QM793_00065 [Muricomes sp.]